MKDNGSDINSGTQAPTEHLHPGLATIISNIDPTGMGILKVQMLKSGSGNTDSATQTIDVSYSSPFLGTTSRDYVSADPDNYNNTQKSYGMWMVPPDVGSTVLVIFVNGDITRGYWIGGVLNDSFMNFMIPGIAATQQAIGSTQNQRLPVAEYNKLVNIAAGDQTKFKKPQHPLTNALITQGLINDDIRGITTSSARREAPSMVFGISTPGPLDKQVGSPRGAVGTLEGKIPNAPVSRLGGTTFVMDDGDDKFIRKQPASKAGPEYAAVEQGVTGGNVTIPHNELVRIRTRTGHQILMHNSEDLIYIGNASGTSWIELTSNGKIDIYAGDSISVHSQNDINFTADRDINFNAAGNINFNSVKNFNCTAAANYEIKAGADGKLTTGGSSNINAGGNHIETAAQIHMNGPAAAPATAAPIPTRVPMHEPWSGHENLDPTMFVPLKTAAIVPPTNPPPVSPPVMFGKYTTVTDTFMKVTGTS